MSDLPQHRTIPSWARALDLVTLVSLLLALSVYLGGGFRVPIFAVRLSVTDPVRPLLIGLVAAAIRHALRRRPTFPAVTFGALLGWWRHPASKAALPVFIATRAGVLLVGLLAVFGFGYANPEGPPYRLFSNNEFLNLPARWDAGWYMGIAVAGYDFMPGRFDVQQNIAFFPGYPMLVRYGRLVLGGEALWAGVAISLAAFLWSLTYLYRLARAWMDDEQAGLALAFIASYPFAVFFSAHYSEALFLLATVAAWYHFKNDRLLPAAAWGLLAGLTRPNGCFLSVPFGLMVVWPIVRNGFRTPEGGWARTADRLAVAAMPGIGMLLYSAFIFDLTGDPLAWAKLHGAWGRTYQSLDTLLVRELQSYVTSGVYGVVSTRLTDFMNGLGVLFAIACTWGVFRRFGAPMAVYILVTVLPPLANGGLLSMGRVTSVVFPCFLWLATAVPARHRTAWVAGFALLQAFVAAMFFTWRPMY